MQPPVILKNLTFFLLHKSGTCYELWVYSACTQLSLKGEMPQLIDDAGSAFKCQALGKVKLQRAFNEAKTWLCSFKCYHFQLGNFLSSVGIVPFNYWLRFLLKSSLGKIPVQRVSVNDQILPRSNLTWDPNCFFLVIKNFDEFINFIFPLLSIHFLCVGRYSFKSSTNTEESEEREGTVCQFILSPRERVRVCVRMCEREREREQIEKGF